MHHIHKLSVTVVLGFAVAIGPGWVDAADDKKSTTEAVKTNVSDTWITAKTKIALFADSRAPGASVNVETTKGMVFLRGKVETEAEKKAAEEIARGVEGVQAVRNELQVVPTSAKKVVEAKDDEITAAVKTRLKGDSRLKNLDVRTDNGVVTLQGKLPNIVDSARASQLAREVPGVRAVRNDTTYENPKVSVDPDRPVTRTRMAHIRKRTTTGDVRSNARLQADVRTAQERLKEKGYDPGPVDGIWGPRTAAAVGEYQRKEKMPVTSRLDPQTLVKLEARSGEAKQKP
jgi:hyperosmotically inducible periplasmic protein